MNTLTEAAAREAGFTVAMLASSTHHDLEVLVKPDAELDGTVKAYDVEEEEFIFINGWLFMWEEV